MFEVGEKVVCVDDTPIPIVAPNGVTRSDCRFPGGFVVEGTVYCISEIDVWSEGSPGLRIVGKPIFLNDTEVFWHSSRFRKLRQREERIEKREVVEV